VLEREYLNWNTQHLEGRIRVLLASLGYLGRIGISFAASHTHVVIQPPPSALMPCFLSFLKASKKYAVVRSVWPYANTDGEEEGGGARRECAVQSENEWWEVWSSVITLAVVRRKKGWVTTEDVMDMAICGGVSWMDQ
jgi:hypothetical protein